MNKVKKLSFIVSAALFFQGWGSSGNVVVVTHPDTKVKTVSVEIVKAIYSLEEQAWSDGSKIIPYNLKENGDIKSAFYEAIGKKPSVLRKHWLRMHLTGEATPPKAVKTAEEMLDVISTTPNAIGYLPKHLVSQKVKVLAHFE